MWIKIFLTTNFCFHFVYFINKFNLANEIVSERNNEQRYDKFFSFYYVRMLLI